MNPPPPPDRTPPRYVYTIPQLLALRPRNPRQTSYPHLHHSHPSLSHPSPSNSHPNPTPPISIPLQPPHPRYRKNQNLDKLPFFKPKRPALPSFNRPKPSVSQHHSLNGCHTPQYTPSSSPPTRSPPRLYSIPHHSPPHGNTSTFLAASPPDKPFPKCSLPTNCSHYVPRLSVRTDAGPNFQLVSEDKRYSASSPRDEYRRRSPSPMASPTASSPPPGFETVSTQRCLAKCSIRPQNAKERDAMYRSRICRGPDIANNFARRIAYRDMACVFSKAAASVEERVGEGSLCADESLEKDIPAVGEVESCAVPEMEQRVGVGDEFGADNRGMLPTVPHNMSSPLSFEDLSRRLAAEVAGSQMVENKASIAVGNGVEDRDKTGALEGSRQHLLGLGVAEEDTQQQVGVVLDQDAVSELSKWFGRIATSTEEEEPCKDAFFMPLDEVEREMTKPEVQDSQECCEELDSALVPFFDTIRNQAIDVKANSTLENCDTHGPTYREEPSDAMENYFDARYNAKGNYHKAVHEEDTDRLETSEVEHFFQSFTNGKPVHKRTETASENHRLPVSTVGNADQDLTSSKTSSSETKRSSDHGELERWFKALASQNYANG